MPSDRDPLLSNNKPSSARSDDSWAVLEEYGSIGVTLVENAEHEPVLQHDFGGPVILEHDTLERHDSIASAISETLELSHQPLDEEGRRPSRHDAVELGGQATIPSEVANLAKNLVSIFCSYLTASPCNISICYLANVTLHSLKHRSMHQIGCGVLSLR